MSEIEKLTPANLLLLLQFVAPGFLAVYFRSFFVRRVEASVKENLVLFVVLSVIYGFVTLPLWRVLASNQIGAGVLWIVWFVVLVLVPVVGGTLMGVGAQKGWLRSLLARIGLEPLSPYRTGWDWAFSQIRRDAFILVTMEDGSSVAGWFGPQSLAASEHTNRDLFLERVYTIDDQGNWSERQPHQGILISGKSIRYVEIY